MMKRNLLPFGAAVLLAGGIAVGALIAQTGDVLEMEASKSYRPSTWFDQEKSFDAGVRSAEVPATLTVLASNTLPKAPEGQGGIWGQAGEGGNSGNHYASITFNKDQDSAVTCIYRGGSSQSKPWSNVATKCKANDGQINKGMVYNNPRCFAGTLTSNLPNIYNDKTDTPRFLPTADNLVPVSAGAPVLLRVDNGDATFCDPASKTCCGDQLWDMKETRITARIQGASTALTVVQDLTYEVLPGVTSGLKLQYGTAPAMNVSFNARTRVILVAFPVGTTASQLSTEINSNPASSDKVRCNVSGDPNNPQTTPFGPVDLN